MSEPTPLRGDQRITLCTKVLSRQLDGEAVLLDLASGSYFGLNDVGAAVWRLLEDGATLDELQRTLLLEYDVEPAQLKQDLRAIVDDLRARKLVQIAG